MKASTTVLVGIGLTVMLLGGCASKVTQPDQYSGFIPSYADLRHTTSASGQPVLRWVADGFSPGDYDTIVFEQLELYPAPRPDDRVNLETLQELQTFTSTNIRDELEQKYDIVANASDVSGSSRTLILHAAITGVTATDEAMQWYEALPVTAVAGAASRAAGYRDQNTELFLETYLIDASTGKPVIKMVRKVGGKTLKDSHQPITTDDFKSAIKTLMTDLHAFINNRLGSAT